MLSWTQAAPVQNTWYTVLDTKRNVELYTAGMSVADANETLEYEFTIDGVTTTITNACAAGSNYWGYLLQGMTGYTGSVGAAGTPQQFLRSTATQFTAIRCKQLKIRLRKTTALGAGTLSANVCYGVWC